MSVNKLVIILFSSFLIFATAPVAPALSTQDQNQDQTKKQEKKGTANKETGKATEKNAPAAEKKAGTTEKTETGKTGAKKAKIIKREDRFTCNQTFSERSGNSFGMKQTPTGPNSVPMISTESTAGVTTSYICSKAGTDMLAGAPNEKSSAF
jgi:hypothetical protein